MVDKKTPLQRMIRPSVPVTLEFSGGEKSKTFRLSFDFNALARIEEQTGLDMLNVFGIWTKMSATVLSAMFWAAALAHHPEYDSPEGLVAMRSYLDHDNAERTVEALWQAYLLFLPEDKAAALRKARADALKKAQEGETENPPPPAMAAPAAESSGSTSGPSPASTSESALASSAS